MRETVSTHSVSTEEFTALRRRPRWQFLFIVTAIVAVLVLGDSDRARPAEATPDAMAPSQQSAPETVSADSLPTPQINGVVWDQVVVGNTVYVAGEFTTARPSGAKAGVSETPRSNLLAYDVRSGELLPFAPVVNKTVRTLAASPDGKRLYIGGYFTQVDGQPRYRIAAFELATSTLSTTFRAFVNQRVESVVATNSTVFVGGAFTTASTRTGIAEVARQRAAAFSASDGSIAPWSPKVADGAVRSMVLSPDGTKMVLGGSFTSLNGSSNPGWTMGAVDTAAGVEVLPWKINATVPKGPDDDKFDYAVYSLSSDGEYVYGTMGPQRFEGTFKARWSDGDLASGWIADCHGDTYSSAPVGDVVYTAGHAHDCGNVNSFGDYLAPLSWYRAIALTTATTQSTRREDGNYQDYAGQPAPSVLDWYPAFNTGLATGANQGPWDVTAAHGYVLYGGEFTRVNSKGQQGLARFAPKATAPNAVGPYLSGAEMKPRVNYDGGQAARLVWPANFDWDDTQLTYQVIRNGDTKRPVAETTAVSRFWQRPDVSAVVTDLGASDQFHIRTVDPHGNRTDGEPVTVTRTGPVGSSVTDYDRAVLADGPSAYWPLDEATGGLAFDRVGRNDIGFNAGVTRNAEGITPPFGATAFSGNEVGYGVSSLPQPAPQVFSVEAWVKTTSTKGGQIVGYGDSRSTTSASYDRKLVMQPNGTLSFGIWTGKATVIGTPTPYNDGAWHHVVATVGPTGSQLIVDGIVAARQTAATQTQAYTGYWNIGGDKNTTNPSWPTLPANGFLAATIDNVAVYGRVLSPAQIDAHAAARAPKATAPTSEYDRTVLADGPAAYWPLNETTGSLGYDRVGRNDIGLTAGATRAVDGVSLPGSATAFPGASSGYGASSIAQAAPQVFSIEAWVKTTTTRGGQIAGFGSTRNPSSPTYDRKLIMRDDGTLAFGVWSAGARIIASPSAYNDGAWHHVVATLGPSGTQLIVDGSVVAQQTAVTKAAAYAGYWNIGGDRNTADPNWAPMPSSGFLAGTIDDVAVYDRALTPAQATAHIAARR